MESPKSPLVVEQVNTSVQGVVWRSCFVLSMLAALLSGSSIAAPEPPGEVTPAPAEIQAVTLEQPEQSPCLREQAEALSLSMAAFEEVSLRSEEWPERDICEECVELEVLFSDFLGSLRRLSSALAAEAADSLGCAGQQVCSAVEEVCRLAQRFQEVDFAATFADATYFLWTESVAAAQRASESIAERGILESCPEP